MRQADEVEACVRHALHADAAPRYLRRWSRCSRLAIRSPHAKRGEAGRRLLDLRGQVPQERVRVRWCGRRQRAVVVRPPRRVRSTRWSDPSGSTAAASHLRGTALCQPGPLGAGVGGGTRASTLALRHTGTVAVQWDDLPPDVRHRLADRVDAPRPRAGRRGRGGTTGILPPPASTSWRCYQCGYEAPSWAAQQRHASQQRHHRIECKLLP